MKYFHISSHAVLLVLGLFLKSEPTIKASGIKESKDDLRKQPQYLNAICFIIVYITTTVNVSTSLMLCKHHQETGLLT